MLSKEAIFSFLSTYLFNSNGGLISLGNIIAVMGRDCCGGLNIRRY